MIPQQQDAASGWTLFFTYGVPTGILLVILYFSFFHLWPFLKARIESADKKREDQVNALIEVIRSNSVFSERISNSLQDMNKSIAEIRKHQLEQQAQPRQRTRGE